MTMKIFSSSDWIVPILLSRKPPRRFFVVVVQIIMIIGLIMMGENTVPRIYAYTTTITPSRYNHINNFRMLRRHRPIMMIVNNYNNHDNRIKKTSRKTTRRTTVQEGERYFVKKHSTIRRKMTNNNDDNNSNNNNSNDNYEETTRNNSNKDNANHRSSNPKKNNDKKKEDNNKNILSRFVSPQIDDPYLPLSDAVTAQVIAPALQVLWITLSHGPRPTWCKPLEATATLFNNQRGSLIVPTLIHGAALASCWLIGALAAEAYRRPAISPQKVVIDQRSGREKSVPATDKYNTEMFNTDIPAIRWDYTQVIVSTIKAGAFACGVLLLCTQLDLFIEFDYQYVQLGDNDTTDFRLLVAAVEVINDIVFEAIVIITWRLYLAYQTQLQFEEKTKKK